ncbi:DDE superfamily endonuclease, CENP-B-like [Plasmopara halstedii]|uniref:DDE superfamily endonuclease, CENP-B-like n=1 Tax=Plasmopara halstedii TaxID=4781 RepID=A0A0P1AMM7_PLAHL|nr:DDE superfamily endonuclease, CENP-B-like [Plasmopara halstedii]CEG42201.1 DDE superfamily endonuclease, CENP-B-like [Plasmopara halstedii]|eukprot:XP_024578570.1 DDE superfamily endonuclease, CENP-B-like [Plasmopara halstedii]
MRFLQEQWPRMDLDQTVLMDETAVYSEDARNQTVDIVGARHVIVRSTGFASMRISVILAASAAGKKLPPILIWKGADKASFEKIDEVYFTYQKKASVDSSHLKRWTDLQFPMVNVSNSEFLIWDSMRAYISKEVKAKCQTRDIKMCVILGGLTSYLKAGDIGIYRYFKDILPPPVKSVCLWVRKAWAQIDEDAVVNFIIGAGFTYNYQDWFAARHDVYGTLLRESYKTDGDSSVDADVFNLDVLDEAFDEIGVVINEKEAVPKNTKENCLTSAQF